VTDPARPLTTAEQVAWAALVDRVEGVDLGALDTTGIDQLCASIVGRYPADHPWAARVADAVRARWRVQRTATITAVWEQIKRDTASEA
jgi:hypothetical protein